MGEATNKTLQSVLALDQTTLTRNLKPLIREGYVTATPGSDRRQKILRLSGCGNEIYGDALVYWQDAQKQIVEQLGADTSHQLLGLSDEILKLG
mgnify:CR=1 FL=1